MFISHVIVGQIISMAHITKEYSKIRIGEEQASDSADTFVAVYLLLVMSAK